MQLSNRTLQSLAVMICGDAPDGRGVGMNFLYRTSSMLNEFFAVCGLDHVHDGGTRRRWVQDVLAQLNLGVARSPHLPADAILTVLTELMDPVDFDGRDRMSALADLNMVIGRDGLAAYLDASGRCHIRSNGTGVSSALTPHQPRPLSRDELAQRVKLATFLDVAGEDEFIEKVLVPLFQRLGFHRVTAPGHKEKLLEFGKDLWMKFQLPTGHWLYFCAQVKRGKIDAKGSTAGTNVAEVLNQAKMAIGNAVFDPDANRKVLLDHLFIISAGEITRAARAWLVERLDQGQRRHIIFMDRDELLDHAARIMHDLVTEDIGATKFTDDMPF